MGPRSTLVFDRVTSESTTRVDSTRARYLPSHSAQFTNINGPLLWGLCTIFVLVVGSWNVGCYSYFHIDRLISILQRLLAFLFIRWGCTNRTNQNRMWGWGYHRRVRADMTILRVPASASHHPHRSTSNAPPCPME